MKYKSYENKGLNFMRSLASQGIIIIDRHLNRPIESQLALSRRYDLDARIDLFVQQLQESGKDHGDWRMYTKCKQHPICIRKEDVRIPVALLDPVSSQVCRRRRQHFAEGTSSIHMTNLSHMGYALPAALTGSHIMSLGCGRLSP